MISKATFRLNVPNNMSYLQSVAVGIILVALASGAWWHLHQRNGSGIEELELRGIDLSCSSCVTEALGDIGAREGLPAAFKILRAYYSEFPDKRQNCYRMAIDLGSSTAQRVGDFTSLKLTPESASCDYGFYQQYPRTLFHKTGNLEVSRDFCTYAQSQIGTDVPLIENACYRGLGQELPLMDASLAGNAQAIAATSLAYCAALAPKGAAYEGCVSGAFFKLGSAMHLGELGLSIDQDDPASLCRTLGDLDSKLCLQNLFKDGILSISKEYFKESIKEQYVEVGRLYPHMGALDVPELMWVLSYERLRRTIGNQNIAEDAAQECGPLDDTLRINCVIGYSIGLAKHGMPNSQHLEIIDFCQKLSARIPVTGARCARSGFNYLSGLYAEKSLLRACADAKRTLGLNCTELPGAGFSARNL